MKEQTKADIVFDILCMIIFLTFFACFMVVAGIPLLIIHIKNKRQHAKTYIASLRRE